MDELIPIYCNNCNLPITKGMKYMKHENGTILCIDCFENTVLKPSEHETIKTSIKILLRLLKLIRKLFRLFLIESHHGNTCPICGLELDPNTGKCTYCDYGWK